MRSIHKIWKFFIFHVKLFLTAIVLGIIISIVIWFFVWLFSAKDYDFKLSIIVMMIALIILFKLIVAVMVIYIYYQAFIRRVKYRDMREGILVYKMLEYPDFKQLNTKELFMARLESCRERTNAANTIVDAVFKSFRL